MTILSRVKQNGKESQTSKLIFELGSIEGWAKKMIYEETYRYLLTNVSSTEFDVCLYSLLKLDWDGHVRASLDELVKGGGTTKKYMRDIIKKFVSKAKGRFVFVPSQTMEGELYRFNLGKSSNMGFNEKTDRYCKKYDFFYDKEFQELPLNAKRLLLMGAFRMSVSKMEKVVIPIGEVIPDNLHKSVLPFTKQRLVDAIAAINQSNLGKVAKVSLATNIFTRKKEVIVTFTEGTLNNYKENHTERWLLRKRLYEAGYQSYMPDDVCLEVEKVGKYLYNSFTRLEKDLARNQGAISGAKDEMVKMARFIYNQSIDKLALSLNSKQNEEMEPKQVSAYFSSIVHAVTMEELAKYAHQADSIKSLLEMEHLHISISKKETNGQFDYLQFNLDEQVSPIKERYLFFAGIKSVLENWCQEWIMSRVKTINEDIEKLGEKEEGNKDTKGKRGWTNQQAGIDQRTTLKEKVYERISELVHEVRANGNGAVKSSRRDFALARFKETVASYFAIQSDRDGTTELPF